MEIVFASINVGHIIVDDYGTNGLLSVSKVEHLFAARQQQHKRSFLRETVPASKIFEGTVVSGLPNPT